MARGDTPGEADDPLAINPAAIPNGMSSLESAGGIGETAAESETGHSATSTELSRLPTSSWRSNTSAGPRAD